MNLPVTVHPNSPDSVSHAISFVFLNVKYPLIPINTPDKTNIHSLCMDSGISHGNIVNNAPTDAPPAIVATTIGRTQQTNVPDEVKKGKNTNNLISHFLPPFFCFFCDLVLSTGGIGNNSILLPFGL